MAMCEGGGCKVILLTSSKTPYVRHITRPNSLIVNKNLDTRVLIQSFRRAVISTTEKLLLGDAFQRRLRRHTVRHWRTVINHSNKNFTRGYGERARKGLCHEKCEVIKAEKRCHG